MKILNKILVLFCVLQIISCKKDDNTDTSFANTTITPQNLKVNFSITQDNSGLVTITPQGNGVARFDVFFGDSSSDSATLTASESVKHIYGEGIFTVRIVGYSINGQKAEATQQLTVSFKAPEDMSFTADPDAANKFKYNVTAKAKYETMFKVYFGEDPNEIPIVFLEGDIISHTYTNTGTYTIKVIALSGGTATTTQQKTIIITAGQINLPVTFEGTAYDYTVTDFGGNATVDDIDPTDATNHVKKSTKANGAQVWAGTTVGTPLGFATKIPVTTANTKMSVKVYSPAAGLKIKLKIEDHNDPTKSVEADMFSTIANAWETLTYDFKNHSSGTAPINYGYNYDKASLFFDFGNNGTGKVFYWDDVFFVTNPSSVLALPIDFESTIINYAFTDFDGGASSVVTNPNASGVNTSSKVGKMVKNAGQAWGGSFLSLTNPIDFSANKTFKMKVYSPRVGAKVLLKVENATNGAISFEKEVATTVANSWEELTFNYSAVDASKSYQKIVLIFDNGTMGNGSANYTFHFDDIKLLP